MGVGVAVGAGDGVGVGIGAEVAVGKGAGVGVSVGTATASRGRRGGKSGELLSNSQPIAPTAIIPTAIAAIHEKHPPNLERPDDERRSRLPSLQS